MKENRNHVLVELYRSTITDREDDRFGNLVATGAATVDDLISDARLRGTDLSPHTLRAAYELLRAAALERILRGHRVEFGLSRYSLEPAGVFTGDDARWDPRRHRLTVTVRPSLELRNALKSVEVKVIGMAQSTNVINAVFDVVTAQSNTRLTPGGMAHLTGRKIRISGQDPASGLFLRRLPDGQPVRIPPEAIGANGPARITFVVPADLLPGEYELSIVTQYTGGGRNRKTPHTARLSATLAVGQE
jgi:hypothetical protein